MKKDDLINEGAAIQEGLERFLQEELASIANRNSNQDKISEYEGCAERGGINESFEGMNSVNPRPERGSATNQGYVRDDCVNLRPERGSAANQGYVRDDFVNQRSERGSVASQGYKGQSAEKQKKKSSSTPVKGDKGKKDKKMKRKKKSTLKSFLTFLAVLTIIAMVGLYFLIGGVYGKMDYEQADGLASEPMKEDGVTNILLIGNDSREQGDDGRSDAMILLSISNKTKKIHMTSLLRDMYVEIPGKDGNRLNAAYAYGGPTLLLETIEQNLGITVNRYVLVNFQAFANLVEAVGGVDLELSNEEVKWVNAYLNEYNLLEGRDITTDYLDESLSGMIHLNGPQALAYCRNRYIGTDFERTNRQRKVIAGIVSKLPVALATNSGELAEGLFPQLTTNLTQAECYSLSLQASKFVTYEMIQSSIPIEGSYKNATIRSMSVLEVDYDMNKKYIRENIYGEE